jgi:hypothetical protein
MMSSRPRAALLGLLAMLLVGLFAASSAYAEAGPFCHHRPIGGEGEGAKIEPAHPENARGEGGRQTFEGKLGTETFEIAAGSEQIKLAFANNTLQCQVKALIQYHEVSLVKPALKGCTVTFGTQNQFQIKAHFGWKWNGTEAQLREQPQVNQRPDIIHTPQDIQPGATELPKGTFVNVALTGSGCGVLAGTFAVGGSASANLTPGNLQEWSSSQTISIASGKGMQHFWNGKEFVGVSTGLTFDNNPLNLTSQQIVKDEQQEIAIFEK